MFSKLNIKRESVYRQPLWLTRTFSTEALIRGSEKLLQSTEHNVQHRQRADESGAIDFLL